MASLSSWQAFAERYPTNPLGQFALGNVLYAAEQSDAALRAFESATQLDPAMGAAWLNVALVRLQQEDTISAHEALSQAAALEGEWQTRAIEILKALNPSSHKTK